jgi:hypothetical protein
MKLAVCWPRLRWIADMFARCWGMSMGAALPAEDMLKLFEGVREGCDG